MAFVGMHVSRYHASGPRPSIVSHIAAARQEAASAGGFEATAAAVFVGGPQNRKITLGEEEGSELRAYVERTGLRVVAHSSYSAHPWRGDPDAARFIREEAAVCQAAGIRGLVVHLPKLPASQVAKYAARLHNPAAPDVRIYLETPAVRPAESYYETPAKLEALFRALREGLDPELATFGLCLDTAHLWTCGVDLQSYGAAQEWLEGLERVADTIPPSCVMIHLNDSARPRGVGPDAHAPLAKGKIWEGYADRLADSGLAAVMDYARRHATTVILERKPKEALVGDYHVLRDLA